MGQESQVASVAGPPAGAVRAQLARIVDSRGFQRAPRLRRFLAHCVEETLARRFERLKEYSLGLDVFDRGDGFDPRADPIVRVDARRLRKALADYYAAAGAGDPIEIVLPTGRYVAEFRQRPEGGAPRWSPAFDQEAYEFYLRGRRRLTATRPERMAEALGLLRASVERDPAFAEAHAAIAEAHFVTAIFGLAQPAKALAAAQDAARAAVAADPELAAGHAQLARALAALDHDFATAEAGFAQALALDPGNQAVRQARAMWLLAPTGRLEEAVADVEAALARKPYSRKLRADLARLLSFAGRDAEAIRHLELVLEFEPDYPGGPWALAGACERCGREAEARAMHERQVRQFQGAFPLVVRWLAAAQALWAGDPAAARAEAAAMEADAAGQPTPVTGSVMTDLWIRVGDADRALDWLERQAERRMLRTLHLAVDPDYAPLRDHPRFRALKAGMGLD